MRAALIATAALAGGWAANLSAWEATSLLEDEAAGTLSWAAFSTTEALVAETDTGAHLTIERRGPATSPLEVLVRRVGGTATPGVDFTWSDTTVRWEVGEADPRSVPVALQLDAETEPTETILFQLFGDELAHPASQVLEIADLPTVLLTRGAPSIDRLQITRPVGIRFSVTDLPPGASPDWTTSPSEGVLIEAPATGQTRIWFPQAGDYTVQVQARTETALYLTSWQIRIGDGATENPAPANARLELTFDNGSLADTSGNASAVSAIGASSYPDGQFGLGFQGGGIDLPVAAFSNSSFQARTIALWFKADRVSGAAQILFELGGRVDPNARFLTLGIENGYLFAGGLQTSGTWDTPTWLTHPAQADRWTAVALVLDASSFSSLQSGAFRLYVDGELVASGSGHGQQAASNGNAFGAVQGFTATPTQDTISSGTFEGILDSARLYDRALTLDEIRDLAGAAPVYDPGLIEAPDGSRYAGRGEDFRVDLGAASPAPAAHGPWEIVTGEAIVLDEAGTSLQVDLPATEDARLAYPVSWDSSITVWLYADLNAPALPYAIWASADPRLLDPTGDPDRDGSVSGVEFLTGTNALRRDDAPLFRFDSEADAFAWSLRRGRDGILQPELSPHLGTWSAVRPTMTVDGLWRRVSVEATSSRDREFLRLRLQLP
jgi:hypothetical protein